jgi:hypothetical protein
LAAAVLLAFGVWPINFFFRMAYTEALFFLLTLLVLYGIERGWSLLSLALLVALATGTRPVGVALLAPLALHVVRDSEKWSRAGVRLCWVMPVACLGLGEYMLFQYQTFGQPFAFALTQEHWQIAPRFPLATRAQAWLTLEPLWNVVDAPNRILAETPIAAIFDPAVIDRFFFVATVILLVIGGCRRWLSAYELAVAVPLLAIPYVTRAQEMNMASMGRFTSVVVPIYLVLGQLICRIPEPWRLGVLALSGFLLGAYAALFAAEYGFI